MRQENDRFATRYHRGIVAANKIRAFAIVILLMKDSAKICQNNNTLRDIEKKEIIGKISITGSSLDGMENNWKISLVVMFCLIPTLVF